MCGSGSGGGGGGGGGAGGGGGGVSGGGGGGRLTNSPTFASTNMRMTTKLMQAGTAYGSLFTLDFLFLYPRP